MADEPVDGPGGPADPPGDEEISVEFVGHDDSVLPEPSPGSSGDPEDDAYEIDLRAEADPERIAELDAKVAQLEDMLARHRADFENYKRRQEREQGDLTHRASAQVVESLLPAFDNLDRALDAVRAEVSADHMQGLELVRQQIFSALTRLGVEEVEALGKSFDPSLHEAISMVQNPGVPPMEVTAVFQKGYILGKRLLRPARVEVNRGEDEPGTGGTNA